MGSLDRLKENGERKRAERIEKERKRIAEEREKA